MSSLPTPTVAGSPNSTTSSATTDGWRRAPVYIDVGVPRSAAEDAGFFLAWIDREMAFFKSAPGFRQPRDREDMLAFFAEARDVYARMMKQ